MDQGRRKRKSRAGCRNCKLRKVKCDEERPRCAKCEAYGVVCNYQKNVPDLQLVSEQGSRWTAKGGGGIPSGKTRSRARDTPSSSRTSTDMDSSTPSSPPPRPPLSAILISADGTSSLYLDAVSVELLNRFRSDTAFTLGGPAMQEICDSHMLRLAFSSPFLMHAALATASAHDRHLRSPNNPSQTKPSPLELYHWSQSTALFNRKLRSPIRPEDYDPFWATAIHLGVVAFASLDASTPDEAWPLNPDADPSNLAWIRISVGKAAIWQLTNPARPDSIFRPMAPAYARLHAPLPRSGLRNVPHVLRQLCAIDDASTAENNPYYTAVQALSRLAGMRRDEVSLFAALAFISQIDPGYEALLGEKDAAALLLLALWYAGAGRAAWWVERRAEVEGRAICRYLERHHWDDGAVMSLLPWRSPVERFEDVLMPPKGLGDWGHVDDMGSLVL